ncbi:MAG: ABC transporter permease subunit [Chthoniobacteraceae bacterium]
MRLFLRQFRFELLKLFSRPRTYLGFAGFLAFEILLLMLLQRDDARLLVKKHMERAGYTFADNFTGPTVAQYTLDYTLTILGALYLALIAGDIVSKEIEDGTMRMTLCSRTSRGRIFVLKFLACVFYTCVLTTFVAGSAMLLGLAFEGTGNLFVFHDVESIAISYAFADGMMVYFFGALPLLMLSMFTVTAIAFMFSCLNVKPAAATVGALGIFVVDNMLRSVPFFLKIRHWFITSRISAWAHIYDEQVPWKRLTNDYLTLLAIDAIAIGIGWWCFRRRDLKP